MLLVGNQKIYIVLNVSHYVLLSCIAKNFLDIEWEKNRKGPFS